MVQVFPYPCIRRFAFTGAKVKDFEAALNLGKGRRGAIYADIGCCFIASDLQPVYGTEFWELGHRLFKSTVEPFPARFIPADIFQLKGLMREDVPELSKVQSLVELRGHVPTIHTSSFSHLFNEEGQYEIAKIMAALLSSEPGSMIFGSHVGRREKSLRTEVDSSNGYSNNMFCYSPESWRSLWDGEIFFKGTVHRSAVLHGRERPDILDPGVKLYLLICFITFCK
ncbi:hypothetical protein DFS33DRAFT_1373334 [Desarmillaria ectypa]|nr:hypothetical protein DFS33DRAFT_1373334 [Desarmillaria ectypa]